MKLIDNLKQRRTYYNLNKTLPVSKSEVKTVIEEITELIPDAFNMKSARVLVVMDKKQDELWDRIFDTFEGKVPREKIEGFKAAAGTILYFYDEEVVRALQEKFPTYADNFPVWANQANGMLQINIWTGLRELIKHPTDYTKPVGCFFSFPSLLSKGHYKGCLPHLRDI